MKAYVWSSRTEDEWNIEFNTLEDLLNFSDNVGHSLVISPRKTDPYGNDIDMEVIIYDDYLDF